MTKKTISAILAFILLFTQAGMIVGAFHISSRLFASTGSDTALTETEVSSPPADSFLWGIVLIIKNTIVDIVRQAFEYVHQTIVLAFIMWIFKFIKQKWTELAPKLHGSLDKLMDKTDIEKKEALKGYLDRIVASAIEAVEATVALQHTPYLSEENKEAIADKTQRSKGKAAAALTLVLKDMAAGGLDKIAIKQQPIEEFLRDLLATIERQLVEEQKGLEIIKDPEGAMPTHFTNFFAATASMTGASTATTTQLDPSLWRCAKAMSINIEQAKKSLPADYLEAINKVVDSSFA